MKKQAYSWVYLVCWSDGSVSIDPYPERIETVWYDEDEDEFIFKGHEHIGTRRLRSFCQIHIVGKLGLIDTPLKPGEYIELRMTE